jgi:hypothetical protein
MSNPHAATMGLLVAGNKDEVLCTTKCAFDRIL